MSDPNCSTHHVGITVNDLEETLSFYRDVLGLSVADRFAVSGEAFSSAVGVEDASAEFVHLDGEGVRIELVEYDPQARASASAGLNQPGASHVGLEVDDVDAFYEGLPDDVATISEPQTTETGSTILFVRDPEGNLVEFLEF
ncbi:VOC family protein [Natrialba swarupiae]|uniref:VOC family protein n=1 Tax=Natrialba swarupiae TaxID=2448032 RepID=A0A5D5AHP9_9EURY|nr:VOC family protein [Natrialba swarupiae]TYT61319.1 VOC family protein [Natrialba swarupiae]